MIKKILALTLSTLIFISMPSVAFAAEGNIENPNSEVIQDCGYNSDEGIMPYSSISGYYNGTVGPSNPAVAVAVTSEGIGGTGITVQTSCSAGTYQLTLNAVAYGGVVNTSLIDNSYISTNGTYYYHDMKHYSPNVVYFNFGNLQHDMKVTIWIYG